jgi:hypothetical protein
MPRVSSRWNKRALAGLAYELRARGYTLPHADAWRLPSFEDYTKDELMDIVEGAEPPTIFGHHEVTVEREPDRMQWRVMTSTGVTLVRVAWRHVYEYEALYHLGHSGDMLAALEVCLVLDPLTVEDVRRLERSSPGITRKPAFVVLDAEAWETEDDEEEDEEPEPPPVPKKPLIRHERRELFPDRKIKL